MKKLLSICMLLVAAAFAHADVVIEQKMESAFMNGNMVMKVKGDKARMDVPSPVGQTTVIMDMKSGEMTTLMHQQKMAMKMNMADAKKAAEQSQKATGIDLTKIEAPKATGKKEKVGEWDCEVYEMSVGGMSSTMWVAKGYPNYKKLMDEMNKISKASAAGMGVDPSKFDLGGMTVKTETNVAGQKITTTLVKAVEQAVDDAEFTVPTGYNEMKMPGSK